MTTFDERERGYEAKFAHDHDLRFRLLARRDKLFALWVADELKLTGDDRADLTRSVLQVAGGPGQDGRVLALVAGRFAAQGHAPMDAYLAAALNRCTVQAEQSLLEA